MKRKAEASGFRRMRELNLEVKMNALSIGLDHGVHASVSLVPAVSDYNMLTVRRCICEGKQ